MINLKDITKAVETLLNQKLTGYIITRNAERNNDPSIAAQNKGWIGIYRKSISYEPYSTGTQKWMTFIELDIEIQVADMESGDIAENRLQDAEEEIMDLLTANKNLNNTVAMTNGYDIAYEYNADEQIYFHSAIITIKAEVRA